MKYMSTLHPKTPIEEEKASWGVAQTVPLSRRCRLRPTGEVVETSEMSREWMSSDKRLGCSMTNREGMTTPDSSSDVKKRRL